MDYGYYSIFDSKELYKKASAYIFGLRADLIKDLRFINGSF